MYTNNFKFSSICLWNNSKNLGSGRLAYREVSISMNTSSATWNPLIKKGGGVTLDGFCKFYNSMLLKNKDTILRVK